MEDQVFCLKDHILSATFEDGGVILDLETRVSHELNQTGAWILELLDGIRDLKELTRTFAEMCEQPEEMIKADIFDFIMNLKKRTWICDKSSQKNKY